MNWFNNFFQSIIGKNNKSEENEIVNNKEEIDNTTLIDEEYLFELEEKLLRSDCGLEFSEYIVSKLRSLGDLTQKQAEKEILNLCIQTLQIPTNPVIEDNKLNIILIVGVNGAGKTTSIGKLAHKFKQENKKVLIAPCDTFRAAANEQLTKWAMRSGAEILSIDTKGKKADSVLYEALDKAQNDKIDILIVDTAGRLQNKKDLMDELNRLANVINKHSPKSSNIQRFLIIDSTTGQNGYLQAKLFNEVTQLTGIILSKFDGSAKGGILFAICHNLKIPIKYLGTGEQMDQLQEFKAENFINKLGISGF